MRMGRHLLLVGGGHAHMMVLAGIRTFVDKGHSVTVIGPSVYHYYSGMGPGMLGKFYVPEDIRFATRHVVEKQGGRFILGKVVRMDADKRIVYLESNDEIAYDVASFNSGSRVPSLKVEGDTGHIYSVKPIEKLKEAQERIEASLKQRSIRVGIVGGGPSSAEVAGNVWRLSAMGGENTADVRIFSAGPFMRRFSAGIRHRANRSLTKRGIKIIEQASVKEIRDGSVILESGESHHFDFIFMSLGVRPSGIFRSSSLPVGPDGGLLVNRYLQSTAYPNVFGGGDCIHFQDRPLDKVGVYAVRQNPILLHNLMAQLEGTPLVPFDPGGDYLLIFNMGDGTGILNKKWFTLSGRLAFGVKDYIDKKFMAKFQAIEKDYG